MKVTFASYYDTFDNMIDFHVNFAVDERIKAAIAENQKIRKRYNSVVSIDRDDFCGILGIIEHDLHYRMREIAYKIYQNNDCKSS